MQQHRISAGAIVEQSGRLLMVHHVKPGHYDFWVSPGGGVKEGENLEEAATREVFEETGLRASIGRLLYIEDLSSPEYRLIKFWFSGEVAAGTIDVSHPEARAEHIAESAWLTPDELEGRTTFPSVLSSRYAADKAAGFPGVVRLPLRPMGFW